MAAPVTLPVPDRERLASLADAAGVPRALLAERPGLYALGACVVAPADLAAMRACIAAVEAALRTPAYNAWLDLRDGGAPGRYPGHGVFHGYDFHLTPDGPRLIEINTNAGGAYANWLLWQALAPSAAGAAMPDPDRYAASVAAMFRSEWACLSDTPLMHVAIVDEDPATQFLYPEFLLARQLLATAGIETTVTDPKDLAWDGRVLTLAGRPVQLVYNRLTDFTLETPAHQPLAAAARAGAAVVTPHPATHRTHADKRNLIWLSDPALTAAAGLTDAQRAALARTLPPTQAVSAANHETLWQTRKQWFFKPAGGYGSKAAWRGDKITRRNFDALMAAPYIAQQVAPPGTCPVVVAGELQQLKADIRCYVYRGELQLVAARLYQGQTTNFRTPGGGFAPVYVRDPDV